MMPGRTIYTSIPSELKRQVGQSAYGETYQRECIRSWRNAGFNVVSVNSESELPLLKPKGLDVEFVSNETSDERTSIGKILSLIRESGEDVAGIVNADCYLLNLGFANDAVLDAAKDSLVTLERIGIDPVAMLPTKLYCGGFDGFFFDARFADLQHSNAWNIGTPQWDYWFPLAMYVAGATLKKPDALMLLHLNHPTRWGRTEYITNALKLRRHLNAMNLDRLPVDIVRGIHAFTCDAHGQEAAIESFLDKVASWIFDARESFELCNPEEEGGFLHRILMGFESQMTFG